MDKRIPKHEDLIRPCLWAFVSKWRLSMPNSGLLWRLISWDRMHFRSWNFVSNSTQYKLFISDEKKIRFLEWRSPLNRTGLKCKIFMCRNMWRSSYIDYISLNNFLWSSQILSSRYDPRVFIAWRYAIGQVTFRIEPRLTLHEWIWLLFSRRELEMLVIRQTLLALFQPSRVSYWACSLLMTLISANTVAWEPCRRGYISEEEAYNNRPISIY